MGEATNPGPGTNISQHTKVFSLNTGGAPGAWRLYDEAFLESPVVVLQECNMSNKEWSAFVRTSAKLGYNGFYQPGPLRHDRWGNQRSHGGVAVLCHKSVPHSFAGSNHVWGIQSIGVWIAGSLLINIYSPPGSDPAVPQLLGMWWEQHRLDSKSWMVLGDFNADPKESKAFHYLRLQGGHLIGNPEHGSRWNSEHFIDWGAVSHSELATYTHMNNDIHLSDHKGFWVEFRKLVRQTKKGRLKPAPKRDVPSWLTKDEWTDLLNVTWTRETMVSRDFRSFTQFSHLPYRFENQDDVQQEWDLFLKCLNHCFHTTYQNLYNNPSCTNDQKRELQTLLRQPGRSSKGSLATFQWVNNALGHRSDPTPGEGVRKLRRRIARLFECRRLCNKQHVPPISLLKKVQLEMTSDMNIPELLSCISRDIRNTQNLLRIKEQDLKKGRIDQWKARLNDPTLKGLSSWVKKKSVQDTQAVITFQDNIASTPHQATSFILQFWSQLWSSSNEDSHQKVSTLVQDFGPTNPQNWSPISFGDLLLAVRDARGAKGPDNWEGLEIRCLPIKAVEAFHRCTLRWHHTGQVPKQFLESRQVNLIKPHKVVDGRVKCDDLRPISVLSGFWRVYASAWAKSDQIKTWSKAHLHKDVSHGKGARGAEEQAELLQDWYAAKGGVWASLDWSQAFDRMNPHVTTEAMLRLGIATPLAHLLQKVWCQHHRFLQYENHVHPNRLFSGFGMPQGDPLSPWILAIWVSAGLRSLNIDLDQVRHVCYMDDRSFWTQDPESSLCLIHQWTNWSKKMGLKESPNKTQIVAKSEQHSNHS